MMNSTEERLQEQIDLHRARGIEVQVHTSDPLPEDEQCPCDADCYGCIVCEGETTISIPFSDDYDAFVEAEKYRDIVGGCDSGAGFGYRDMQLCARFPNLK